MHINSFIVLHYMYSEALGVDCDVNQEVPFGRNKVITFNGSAPLNVSCNDMTFRSTDQHMLCIRNQIFQDPNCAVSLLLNDTKSGQVINIRSVMTSSQSLTSVQMYICLYLWTNKLTRPVIHNYVSVVVYICRHVIFAPLISVSFLSNNFNQCLTL